MKKNLAPYILCSIPFFLFFLQYPLQYSLTGDLDGIANLAMYKEMKYWLDSLFTSQAYTTICYPIENAWVYFGADFGIGFIHLLFNYIGFNDLWAHYLFFSVLFSLNSCALYLLIKVLYGDFTTAIIASLIFNFSHFGLANLENPNTLVFFFSFISIYYFIRYEKSSSNKNKYLMLSIIWGAIQIYLSPYNFLFHCLIISCFVIYFDFKKLISWQYVGFALIYLAIISPYVVVFILGPEIANSYNAIEEYDAVSLLSLSLNDIFKVLNNHLYLEHKAAMGNHWLEKINAAYIGLVFYLTAFIAIIKYKIPHKKLFITISTIGYCIALGPYIMLNGKKLFPFLMYPFYEYLRFDDILRIPIRAFFICIFGLTLIIAGFLYQIKKQSKLIYYLIFALILVENVPYKMDTYAHKTLLFPDKNYITEIKESKPKNVLNLPTNLFSYQADRREFYYMYWHHLYQSNILNGNLAFFPEARMQTYKLLKNNNFEQLLKLIELHSVDRIIFHKDLIYSEEEKKLLNEIYLHPEIFTIEFESATKTILKTSL